MVPRKIAFRAWSHLLRGEAQRLRYLAGNAHRRETRIRHPEAGSHDFKRPARLESADIKESWSKTFNGWVEDDARKGAPIEDELFALISRYIFRDTDAARELQAWAVDRGGEAAEALSRASAGNLPEYAAALLTIHDHYHIGR